MPSRRIRAQCAALALLVLGARPAAAQQSETHDETSQRASGWHFMQDWKVFGMYNHQGGPRGGDEFRLPDWWMGMFQRTLGPGEVTFNTMLSLEPALVGEQGYREIFQVGESLDGRPLVDRQHPHDLFMQLAGVWRVALSERTGLTIAGGPVGEPAIGPVAFMHRASAAELPLAPLSHHTFDSTHISFGVITAAVDRGPWTVEGSLFNGREPDQHRWDFDFGPLDSVAGRVWYKPSAEWELQASAARLKDPEALEPGTVTRATASGSWVKRAGEGFSAVTAGFGINAGDRATRRAFFAEGTRHAGSISFFGRLELAQVETGVLLSDEPAGAIDEPAASLVSALSAGMVRDVFRARGVEGGVGASVSFYGVPGPLEVSHGTRPVSFQVFFRLWPAPGPMGHMFEMRMSRPMVTAPEGRMHDHMMMD